MIPNFKIVIPGKVYRSGQPYLPSHWQALKDLGVKTVLKLNYATEGSDDGADTVGISLYCASMGPQSVWGAVLGPPDEWQIRTAVSLLTNEDLWPMLVHCTHGQDRTGLIVAMFRVVKQAWSTEAARNEALENGFHPELIDLDRAWWKFCETPR